MKLSKIRIRVFKPFFEIIQFFPSTEATQADLSSKLPRSSERLMTEAKRVCGFAEDKGVLVVPHCWKSAIGIAASAHLSATTTACPYIEFLPSALAESQLRKDLVLNELPVVDGRIYLPEQPGLGIELNEDKLNQYLI